MATLTIRQLDEALVRKIKQRAAAAGHSMEEEVRGLLNRTYGTDEQMKRQRESAERLRRLHAEGLLPKSHGVDSVDLIREMREERLEQLLGASPDDNDDAGH
jgi:plasmid stability protein